MVMLALLISGCTEIIPVKLALPELPDYAHNITDGITVNRDTKGRLMGYTVSVESMTKIAKNKERCREDNTVLRAIILTTH